MIRFCCLHCHATTHVREDEAHWPVHCARCGQTMVADRGGQQSAEMPATGDENISPAGGLRTALSRVRHLLGLSGRLIPCPDCGAQVSRLAASCPKCGRVLSQRANISPAGMRPRAKWKTIMWSTIVFIGLPAVVIFLIFQLCAPHAPTGGHAAPRPRGKSKPHGQAASAVMRAQAIDATEYKPQDSHPGAFAFISS